MPLLLPAVARDEVVLLARAGRIVGADRWTYSRVDAYRGCAEGTLPRAESFAWVVRNQPIAFQYVMHSQTNAFNHEQEQAVINAFYGIRNPADRRECRAKRPLRLEDPTDGTHCLVNKTIRVPLVGQGS